MRPEERVSTFSEHRCIFCNLAEETEITGPLSCEKDVAAHQNCLLYSSGIFCKSSPTYDDLFGFEIEDVKRESKRGRKLKCSLCKKSGATAGCEVKSCKRTYHYPCAHKDNAVPVENSKLDTFLLYCKKHSPHNNNMGSEKGAVKSSTGNKSSEASEQDNSHGESESDTETPQRRNQCGKRKRVQSSTDSDETQSIDLTCAPVESEFEEYTPPEQNMQHTVGSENERCSEEPMQVVALAPEHDEDLDESQSLFLTEYRQENVLLTVITDSGPSIEMDNSLDPYSPAAPSPAETALNNLDQSDSVPEQAGALTSSIIVPPNPLVPACPTLNPPPSGTTGESYRVNGALSGDILNKVERCASRDIPPLQMPDKLPESHVQRPSDHPLDLTALGGCCSGSFQHVNVSEPVAHSDMSDMGAVLFWRRCNEVGCTEAIFSELTRQINSLAERVQMQHATQQDYILSLRILEASGKLPAIFKQMEQDLKEQERELQRKKEALRDAKAVLNKNKLVF